ncbi:DUF302 domain-containing protein [Maricaulis sp. CAU 1757]
MTYYFAKTLDTDFQAAIDRVTAALKEEGFGVLTEIDVKATMKKKLDVEFRDYRILGACNPQMAHKALQAEDKIGTMLPCNVIVQDTGSGIEVAAVDPAASMQAVDNDALAGIAGDVRDRLRRVIDSL